jgi:hypothetical protein
MLSPNAGVHAALQSGPLTVLRCRISFSHASSFNACLIIRAIHETRGSKYSKDIGRFVARKRPASTGRARTVVAWYRRNARDITGACRCGISQREYSASGKLLG